MKSTQYVAPDVSERIVLLAEYYESGGTRTYLRQLLDFYANRGTSVLLVGTHSKADREVANWLSEHSFSYSSYARVLGGELEISTASHPKVWSVMHMRRERSAFRRFLKEECADGIVVSAGTPGKFAGAAGAVPGNIYILHTYPHGRRQEVLGRWIMRAFLRPVRVLVAVSDFESQEVSRLWRLGHDRRLVVIPNTSGPVVELPLQRRTPFGVVTASWLEPYKEPLEWLEIAAAVSQRMGRDRVRFTWLGDGSMLNDCREAATSYQDTADVNFVGHSDSVTDAYKEASIYLQTSSTENMSLSVIDALRFGVPAVVTNVGGLPEIVDDEVTGLLVPVHDVGSAVNAILRLLEDEPLRVSMAAASQSRYRTEFAPERWFEQMSAVHDTVFGHRTNSQAVG